MRWRGAQFIDPLHSISRRTLFLVPFLAILLLFALLVHLAKRCKNAAVAHSDERVICFSLLNQEAKNVISED
jgi:hypothetical protein